MTATHQSALELIETQRTMILATSAGGVPWSAPVYFLYQKPHFYFFSNPASRHITEALASDQAAAAIFSEDGNWQTIAGLQMSGRVTQAPAGSASAMAFRDYVKKFPTVKSLFANSLTSLSAFSKNSRSRFYTFEADTVFYMNNAEGLGQRTEITL